MKTSDIAAGAGVAPRPSIFSDLSQLIKARLTLLVLLTTAVGYYLGAEFAVRFNGFFNVVFGTAAAAAGAAALNQWWERTVDAAMLRTRSRPVPAGRMPAREALAIGIALSVLGVVYLVIACNALSAVLAGLTILIYIFAYTPLKRLSSFNTLVGTVPGAIPPMIGWAAARGRIDAGAWSLFVIMVLWQLPHFFAIAWMYRDDYTRGGLQMISAEDRTGERSASQSVLFCILLLALAGLPGFVGTVSAIYVPIAMALSGALAAVAMRFLKLRTPRAARMLFLASIIYLPLLFGAMVWTKL